MSEHDEEPALLSAGWSTTVAEMKAALADIPDDYEIMLENAEVGDIDISTVTLRGIYPPSATGSPGLVILSGGQIVNSEYDYENRMDAHHQFGGDLYWNQAKQEWVK